MKYIQYAIVLNIFTGLGLVDSNDFITNRGYNVIIGLIVAVATTVIVKLFKYVDKITEADDEDEEQLQEPAYNRTVNVQARQMNMENRYDGMNTAVLIRAILGDLNCDYEENEDGSDLIFSYQGEMFVARAPVVDNPRIRLFDVNWYNCPLDKLEEISCMQKAINIANTAQMCTAIYYIDNEHNDMIVYSKADFLIWSAIPQPDNYMRMWLDNMFYLKQNVIVEFEKEKQKIGI